MIKIQIIIENKVTYEESTKTYVITEDGKEHRFVAVGKNESHYIPELSALLKNKEIEGYPDLKYSWENEYDGWGSYLYRLKKLTPEGWALPHKEDGPCGEYINGYKTYYINGDQIEYDGEPEDFSRWLKLQSFK